MKILHTADWHLGRVLFSRPLIEQQRHFIFSSLLPALDSEKPDILLISGDIFDRPIAPVDAVRLFDEALYEICVRRRIRTAIIPGNHDGADRLSVGGRLLEASGLFIAPRLCDGVTPVSLEDEFGAVQLWMLPYFDPAEAREWTGDGTLRGFAESYRAVLDRIRERMDPAARQILMAHCFVTGAQQSDSEAVNYVGTSGEVPASVFEGFDYVALGHLHAPQSAGGIARYAGSPLKYSFDEEHQKKSMTLITLSGDECTVRLLPVAPMNDLRTITGSFDGLLSAGREDAAADDFIFANITDDRVIFEPMARLREVYPNILGLKFDVSATASGSENRAELRKKLQKRNADPMSVFDEFLIQACAREPDDEMRGLFSSLLQEEGSI